MLKDSREAAICSQPDKYATAAKNSTSCMNAQFSGQSAQAIGNFELDGLLVCG